MNISFKQIRQYTLEIILIGIIILSGVVRFVQVNNYHFPFTNDQARDLIDIRSMIVGHDIKVTGPTTSINGVFLGPAYYYILAPAFIVGRGDPATVLHWQILLYQASGIAIFLVFKKSNKLFAFIASFLFLLMPIGFQANHYFWNAHVMPIAMVFYSLALYIVSQNRQYKYYVLLGIATGIALQIEAALGVLCFPSALIYISLKRHKIANILIFVGVFVITLLPQIVFELTHNFIMTSTLLGEFTGTAKILGASLTGSELIHDRIDNFKQTVFSTHHFYPKYLLTVYAAGIAYTLYFRKQLTNWQTEVLNQNAIFVLITIIFFTLYKQPIKHWYLMGVSVPLVLMLAVMTSAIRDYKYGRLSIILFLVMTMYMTIIEQSKFLKVVPVLARENQSSLISEIQTVDWVYTQAQGQPFSVFSYVASVYDFPYQYVFWWYGTSTYGYQPAQISYLPNVPEYISGNQQYWNKSQPTSEESPTFLIIERTNNEEARSQWLSNFDHLCIAQTTTFEWGTQVQERYLCPESNSQAEDL